jgi:hypothetical protein
LSKIQTKELLKMHKNLKYIIIFVFLQAVAVSTALAQENNPASDNGATAGSYAENLKQWQGMTEEQRQEIRQKVQEMSPEQREVVRENAQKFRQLPKEERNRIQDNFKRFRELPDERKEVIRERSRRFRELPPEKRSEMRLKAREKEARQENVRDRREDVPERREDRAALKEDPRDRREDVGGRGPGPESKPGKDNDHVPPGPRRGQGTNSGNFTAPQGGPDAGLNRKPVKEQGPGHGGPRGGGKPKKID